MGPSGVLSRNGCLPRKPAVRVKLFTLRYSSTPGGFDDSPIREFQRDKEILAVREYFFAVNEVPHLTCSLTYQEAIVPSHVPRDKSEATHAAQP